MARSKQIEDAYALSPMQQGMLFHSVYAPDSGVYVTQLVGTVDSLDVERFQQAWQQIVDRHPILRTAFVWEGVAEPLQVVGRQVQLSLAQHDWRDCAPAEQRERLETYLADDRKRGFKPTRAPLMRLAVIRLAATRYHFIWSLHHLLLDGWSAALVLREALACYSALAGGRTPPLARPRPYRDYIAWLEQQDLDAAATFWRRTLQGVSAPTPLQVDHAALRPAEPPDGYAVEGARLAVANTSALQALARQHGLTLNTLVQGAWALLLSRYSDADDVIFGATVAGRPPELVGSDAMVGLFINTLPVRAQVDHDAQLLAWLQQLQAQQAELRRYEYSPLVRVQGWSDVPRGLPLFESVVVFENYPVTAALPAAGDGLAISDVRFVEQSNYPLTLLAAPGAALSLRISYDRRRFAADTISRMLGHLQTLLEGIAAQPGRRVAELPLLTEAERRQLLVDWNATRADYPVGAGLHTLIEAQAARTPETIALVFDRPPTTDHRPPTTPSPHHPNTQHPTPNTQHLTYRELNRRANQLAHHLRTLGVGPEVMVGLYMERSIELLIGLLGILKAGGAYVPLDPAYPPARLAFILDDAQASVLVTQKSIYDLRSSDDQPQELKTQHSKLKTPVVIYLDADRVVLDRAPVDDPAGALAPAQLAYVIYTSGSTGAPKGAMNTHRGIVNRLLWMQGAYGLLDDDAVLQKTPFSFDVSVWEFFWPLLCGARLVLARPGGHQDSAYLAALIGAERITTLHFVPSMLQMFLEEPELSQCMSLRRVICSGEALPFELQERFFSRLGVALHNLYGPTEAAVDVTFWACERGGTRQDVPIGRPIGNMQIYVLDRQLQPAPIGVAGEMYIGGVGLARGYLRRPDLTAERFIPNPFAGVLGVGCWGPSPPTPNTQHPTPNTRLYRPGDQARYGADGALEFLGRLDEQVKLRGFRIELGEIEAALGQHPAVRETVVVAREDAPGDKRLVAYIVPKIEDRRLKIEDSNLGSSERLSSIFYPLSSDLRAFLAERLPDYMVPAAFVVLDALPLTANGKIDRRALPVPDAARPALGAAFVTPRTPVEVALAEIWATALGVAEVGIDDPFFALGGDSIRSLRVLSQARARGLPLTLPQLFARPTIRALARLIDPDAAPEPASAAPTPPFQMLAAGDRLRLPDGLEDAYPLTMLQAGMLFHSEYHPDTAIYHNVGSVHLRAPLDASALHAALQQLAARHTVLRTSFDLTTFSEPLQLVHPRAQIPLEAVDLRALPATEQAAALAAWQEAEKGRKFDWTRAPLLRVWVHRRSETTFQFSWAEHHAILDGWSIASMLTELFQRYVALMNDRAAPLAPPPTTPFRAFVALEREILASEAAQRYWADAMRDASVARLPRWPVTDEVDGLAVRTLVVPLAPALAEGLNQLARAAGVPLKSVLLATHLRMLALLSGALEVVTGLVASGRPETDDGEQVLGLFLNTLPLRLKLPGGSWRDLARATFEAEQQQLPYRRYPLAAIQRMLGGQPLFEAAFNFIHFHVYQRLADLPDLAVLEGTTFEQTNFAFASNFRQEPGTGRVQLTLTCDASAIGAAQLAAIGGYYATMLTLMAHEPDGRYEAQCLLSAEERRQVLSDWNATRTEFRSQESGVRSEQSEHLSSDRWCIHHMFAAQAARTPDAVAVVFEGRPTTNDQRPTTTPSPLHPIAPSPHHPITQHPTPNTQQLTYRELNERANRLAHHLRALGVGPEVRVGLCLERSPALLIGLLGIWKAGGVYVPLDPAYPDERLAFMLEDSQAAVLITTTDDRRPTTDHRRPTTDQRPTTNDDQRPTTDDQRPTTDDRRPTTTDLRPTTDDQRRAPLHPFTLSPLHPFTLSPPHLVTLSRSWSAIALCPADNLVSALNPANLAYLIYTSGTSGRPKAVMVEHHSLVNVLCASQQRFQIQPDDVMPAIAAVSFDIALFELLTPLLGGGTVRLLSQQHVLDLPRLLVELERVTLLHTVPSLMRQIVRAIDEAGLAPQVFDRLRRVFIGGDAVPPELLDAMRHAFRRAELCVLYGPTEATIICVRYEVPRDMPLAGLRIGAPLDNLPVLLLDSHRQLVPLGVPGELYVGGAGVTRGYLGRPDLTAERFVPNPFGEVLGDGCWVTGAESSNTQHPTPVTRLYRTGDLARWLPGGTLEFLGRADAQVKVRGYRIEPGEVAATLMQHPAVRDAAVVARAEVSGEQRLVAYLVQGSGVRGQGSEVRSQESDVGERQTQNSKLKTQNSPPPQSPIPNPQSPIPELRDFLKEKLPDYMVPAAFVVLDALPLTSHGKLDWRALPAPDANRPALDSAFVAPRTPVEELLAQLWAAVLGLERVGVHDNFFALGGHSLSATQLIARIRSTFQVELPLRSLFVAPTLAELAEQIGRVRREEDGQLPPPLLPAPRDEMLPLSFAQQRLWFFDQWLPKSPLYNVPIALRLSGPLDGALLVRTLGAIRRRHEVLRTTFPDRGGNPAQVIAPPSPLPLPLVDLRALPASERDAAAQRLAAAEARRPFDLARGPLVRATLLRLDQAEHVVLLTLHHIVSDGWSMGVLVRELAAIYSAEATGQPASLPELPIQYADYAVWQRQWLQGPARQGDKETRRQGDKEQGASDSSSPTPNTQHPTPHPPSPIPHPPSPIERQLAYWRTRLAGLPALQLPSDYPRPPVATIWGAHHGFALPQALRDGLVALSRAEGVTLFMALLAAFQALLARYAGQEDIAVGTPIAGRTQAATEDVIGCFVNTLVLRTDLSGNPSFRELLQRVREVALGAYAHQDLPFEMLVEELQPPRDLSRHPLFQVMLALQNAPHNMLELPGLTAQPLAVENTTTKFDLSVSLTETADGLAGALEYRTDLFTTAMIVRMAGHLEQLLAGAVADPTRRLADLPLLTAAEREQLLVEWNATAAEYPREQCIHDLFAAQAARTPDRIALVFERPTTTDQRPPTTDPSALLRAGHRRAVHPFTPSPLHSFTPQHLTYCELNARANQLARYLQTLGVGPEVRAGICVERTPEMVVGLLGVLKAGGAYVPLDPAYPDERLAFMLQDSQATVLITTTDDRPLTTDHRRPTTDDRPPTTDHRRPTNVRVRYIVPPTTNDDRSTTNDGEPRTENQEPHDSENQEPGTHDELKTQNSKLKTQNCTPSLPHRVTLSGSWPATALYAADDPSGALDPTNLAYLIYTSGSTGTPKGVAISHRSAVALLSWARSAFTPDQLRGVLASTSICFDLSVFELFVPLSCGGTVILAENALQLPQLPDATRVTLINTVPSAMTELLREGGLPPSVQVVNLAGEPLPLRLVQQLYQQPTLAQVVNLYGPSEDTTYSTYAVIEPASAAPPAIGRPIANTRVYLLDRHMQPLPLGVPGELYLGGSGLARGYLNRPALTAERFVPNPFAGVTGDGCWVSENPAPNTQHPTPNTRLYRTGDLARYRADGSLEFLGRVDQQVKLRGYRIELGEVEAALERHPAVRESVVIVREDAPGDVRLVAYVVPDQRPTTNDQRSETTDSEAGADSSFIVHRSSFVMELRGFLKAKLPDYMIPSAFVLLDALPLTPNGKVDRRALPTPDGSRPAMHVGYVAPQTAQERSIAAVWRSVLRLERVGLHDNFFDLGGHSLLMVQVRSKLREELHADISMIDLFSYPTISALADHLRQALALPAAVPDLPAQVESRSESRRRRRQMREAYRETGDQKEEQDG